MRYALYMVFLLLFLGCSTKHKVGYFDTQKNQQQAIINTKKAHFYIGKQKYLISATYLNPIKSLHVKDEERFLISIYSSNLNHKNIITKAKLNNKKERITWKLIETTDPLVSFSPIVSKWGDFYILKAPKTKKEHLKLTLEIYKKRMVSLNFEKPLLK